MRRTVIIPVRDPGPALRVLRRVVRLPGHEIVGFYVLAYRPVTNRLPVIGSPSKRYLAVITYCEKNPA